MMKTNEEKLPEKFKKQLGELRYRIIEGVINSSRERGGIDDKGNFIVLNELDQFVSNIYLQGLKKGRGKYLCKTPKI